MALPAILREESLRAFCKAQRQGNRATKSTANETWQVGVVPTLQERFGEHKDWKDHVGGGSETNKRPPMRKWEVVVPS
jgi:hypothetical protein